MAAPQPPSLPNGSTPPTTTTSRTARATQVIVVGSVMFTFISYWKTAAVVLCDLASTAYYIGGITEQSIGKAAPWFILGVMLFSYAVRSVYIESCSMFVRGGVYRVVREALGGTMGKLAVSALLFDYILTGPISSVSAGQYLTSLLLELVPVLNPQWHVGDDFAKTFKSLGSMTFAIAVTLYFFWQNLRGIHESADKAFKIMMATTVMAGVMIVWCGISLALKPDLAKLPTTTVDLTVKPELDAATLRPKIDPETNAMVPKADPLGFIPHILPASAVEAIRQPATSWVSLIGLFGVAVAFGHSILAMSGEETLAQVYREVESPKLKNFKKAALVVFLYSLFLTSLISFFAVMLIPDDVRMAKYSENLIGGLAMSVAGPQWAKLALNAFVVVIGSLILSGAVNTAIIGSNGVLNRVAEDGVVPAFMQKPHPRYGTTHRILYLILAMKLITILVSRGDVLLLGEAYAFGVVWSFVFMSFAMVRLRMARPDIPRAYKVPLNVTRNGVEYPIGLMLVFLVLITAAGVNLLTKEIATVAGIVFTGAFWLAFTVSERINQGRNPNQTKDGHHQHLEQFTVKATETASVTDLGLSKPYTKLVAIRSPHNLFMLEKALAETDPTTTSVVVMTAKVVPTDEAARPVDGVDLDRYDQELMTAVVERAEKAGKRVKPIIVPTNNPLHAVLGTAAQIGAQEVILGASNKFAADVQLEQVALYWLTSAGGDRPITVRLLGRDRDVYYDIGGGNRIPRISERQAKSVSELRAAGVGVGRALLVHDGTGSHSDLFQTVLTGLDDEVTLALAHRPDPEAGSARLQADHERARKLGRDLTIHPVAGDLGPEVVRLAQETPYDLIILPMSGERAPGAQLKLPAGYDYILSEAHCPVFLALPPLIPDEAAKE